MTTTTDIQPEDTTTFGAIVEFSDNSESFVHGYEAGAFDRWVQLANKHGFEIPQLTVHKANKKVLERIAHAYGWEATFEPCRAGAIVFPTYVYLTARKVVAEEPRLRVVKE